MYYLQLLYLFLPAFVANASPVLLPRIPLLRHWNEPIDKALLGEHKTVRGFLISPLIATFIGFLQYVLQWIPQVQPFMLFPLTLSDALLFGFVLGLGAMVGDSVKSFLKRKIGILPGRAWPIIDGIDYIVGALVLFFPFYLPSIDGMVFLLVIGPLASLVANVVSYAAGWKDVWY